MPGSSDKCMFVLAFSIRLTQSYRRTVYVHMFGNGFSSIICVEWERLQVLSGNRVDRREAWAIYQELETFEIFCCSRTTIEWKEKTDDQICTIAETANTAWISLFCCYTFSPVCINNLISANKKANVVVVVVENSSDVTFAPPARMCRIYEPLFWFRAVSWPRNQDWNFAFTVL